MHKLVSKDFVDVARKPRLPGRVWRDLPFKLMTSLMVRKLLSVLTYALQIMTFAGNIKSERLAAKLLVILREVRCVDLIVDSAESANSSDQRV